ncbi:MAG: ABC transporter permease subunit [Gammaproteobacteria bacterium]|nr:ABC transporter permease subunit [Gammaproteobacteria bacterium]
MATPYHIGQVIPISLDPHYLPFYAGRTVVRMLIALVFSLLFTFIFGTWAAKSHRAERLIVPMLDVLQSVPILGYLSLAIPAFIALFPGSLLGPECAAIFVIFTSQAWNMTFGFYQTVRTVPVEVQEAAHMFHLSAWQRFWRIDVPFSMPGLLWNTMASMSAGWFFVVASEAITTAQQEILLPGIGSYIYVAIVAADLHAISYAVIAMFIVIIIYDQLLFRPLVAWSEKFKAEREGAGLDRPDEESWVINLFRRTRMLRNFGIKFSQLFDMFVNIPIFTKGYAQPLAPHIDAEIEKYKNWLWNATTFLLGAVAVWFLAHYIAANIKFYEIWHVFLLGLITAFRVFILIILCSLVWVPVGIWIGRRPQVSHFAQPIAQILAAFPANLFYPFIVMMIVTYHLNPNIWLTPLMILGSQWYILFNVIAGASTLPKDLLQVADNLSVSGWLRWKKLLLPGIFPYYVTGAITAAGGAWNASIVAEVATWGNEKVEATGLGAYIAKYSALGQFAHIALGIGMMCLLVLIFNRLLWRPLYDYAETRFSLE